MRQRLCRYQCLFWAALVLSSAPLGMAQDRYEEAPINYSSTPASNVVSALQESIEANTASLSHEEDFGYLRSVLAALKVPVESQVLVYSKTSLQQQYISPETPRAIYFNDDVYIGTVPNGAVIEVSVADPNLGAVFYALSQESDARPAFSRKQDDCLQCHGSTLTDGVPGHMVRSVFTDANGFPILKAGSRVTTQLSPMEERWGGWYVTGTHGAARHMGNVLATETDNDALLDREAGANRTSLDPRVDPGKYLAPHSDIVALMVLEHQTRMHNLMTQVNFETRIALKDQAIMDEMLERPADTLSESTQRRIANVANKLVDYMLFVKEAPLRAPVAGTSGFKEYFEQLGPKDSEGRSLREFDLESRLFKYPLSYLIYSPQFDGLPKEAKDYVYMRLWNLLNGAGEPATYAHLDAERRKALREILRDTKPSLPDYWRP